MSDSPLVSSNFFDRPNWKEDCIEILRQGQLQVDLRSLVISKFLECTLKQVQTNTKNYRGLYYRNIIITSFEEFLKSEGYSVLDQFGMGSNAYYSLERASIEILPKQYKSYVVNGYTFIRCGNVKLAVSMENSEYNDRWSLSIAYFSEYEQIVTNFIEKLESYAKEHSFLKKSKIDPDLHHLTLDKKYTWGDIVLPGPIKNELQLNVDKLINSIEFYRQNNITFKRGLILKGKPGTGKTLICKVLAHLGDCTFIWVTPKHLTNSRSVSYLCELARELSPSILFLEDIDLYGESRSTNSNNCLLGELMNQLDGLVENHYVIVIATTNKIEGMEEALRNRPGRFDRVIDIPVPDFEGRLSMLEIYSKQYKLENVDLKAIANQTNGFTGAHIKELVTTAVIAAVDERSFDTDKKVVLKQEFFICNMDKVRNKKVEATMGFNVPTKPSLSIFDDDDNIL
jgi:cell division protease FtsH